MRPYTQYVYDYARENNPDMIGHMNIEEDGDIEESLEPPIAIDEDGNKAYKENYFLRDHLQYSNISKPLSTSKAQNTIIEITGKFIDEHAKQLSTSGPVFTFTFGAKQVKPLYELFNIDADGLIALYNQMIQETYYGKISKFFTGWVTNAPHKLLLNGILIDSIQNGYNDIIECCEYMWAFTEYPLMFRKYFSTGVKEDVMDYTIEHLGSKFKIKQMKNVGELMKYDATKSVESKMEDLKKGVDNVYLDLMYRMRNQFNVKMKNISIAYYKNSEANASQHNNVTTFDDGQIADQEGQTSQIAQIIDHTIEKFGAKEKNDPMLKVAADGVEVNKGNLSECISLIYADKNNNLPKFIEDVITSYFKKFPGSSTIDAGEFLNFGLSMYRSISSSKDELYAEVKEILDHWMNDVIEIRKYYSREATVISYTRAIYNYFILMINYYN